jgi:hypothetical protein
MQYRAVYQRIAAGGKRKTTLRDGRRWPRGNRDL